MRNNEKPALQEMNFNIGAKVFCFDEKCGTLDKVVFDSKTEEVTDLIIRKGLLLKTDKIVPIESVLGAGEDAVYLSVDEGELQQFPDYEEVELRVNQFETMSYEDQLWKLNSYGLYHQEPIIPSTKEYVHQGVAPGSAIIERDTPVVNLEGEIGTVDHVLIGQKSHELTHVVVDRGLINPAVVIPKSLITEVDQAGILVDAKEETLEMLTSYIRRDDNVLLADFQNALSELAPLIDGVDFNVSGGVIRLTGVVPDVGIKRRVEAAARSIEGVLDVENVLNTDTGIRARVISALDLDPQTEVAVIHVESKLGVITLSGQVDEENILRYAEQIASQQTGVLKVENQLEIGPDRDAPLFQFRQIPSTKGN